MASGTQTHYQFQICYEYGPTESILSLLKILFCNEGFMFEIFEYDLTELILFNGISI